jgi:hypothetical protein
MNGNVVYTKKYHIVNYILEHFDLFFSNLGITSNCYPKYDKSYDNAKLSEIQFSTIDNILSLFRNSDVNKIYSDTIVEEMVNHTKSFTKYLKVKNNQNIGVYFDSMPSIAKIKEQVSRRVAIDSYIIKDIIEKFKIKYEKDTEFKIYSYISEFIERLVKILGNKIKIQDEKVMRETKEKRE